MESNFQLTYKIGKPQTKKEYYKTKTVTYYPIEIKENGQLKETQLRRYSYFDWLYQELLYQYPQCVIPPLPGKNAKTMIGYEGELYQRLRIIGLQLFLDSISKTKYLRCSSEFQAFLKPETQFQLFYQKSYTGQNTGIKNSIISVKNYIKIPDIKKIWTGNKQRRKGGQSQIDQDFNSFYKYYEQLVKRKENAVQSLQTVIKNSRQSVQNSVAISMCFESLAKFQNKENPNSNDGQLLNQISETRQKGNDITEAFLQYLQEELEAKLTFYKNYTQEAKNAILRREQLADEVYQLSEQKKALKLQHPEQIQEIEKKKIAELNHKQKNDLLSKNEDQLKQELEQFKQICEYEIRTLMQEFVERQKNYAKQMLKIWEQCNQESLNIYSNEKEIEINK